MIPRRKLLAGDIAKKRQKFNGVGVQEQIHLQRRLGSEQAREKPVPGRKLICSQCLEEGDM